MQWEQISPEEQEDQIEAFFATKERREAVTNNPVENKVCVWLSPLQRLGDVYFPNEEEAIVGTVKAGVTVTSLTPKPTQTKTTSFWEYWSPTRTTDNDKTQTSIENGNDVTLRTSKSVLQQDLDNSGIQEQTQVEAIADALARQLSAYMSAGWEGVHI